MKMPMNEEEQGLVAREAGTINKARVPVKALAAKPEWADRKPCLLVGFTCN